MKIVKRKRKLCINCKERFKFPNNLIIGKVIYTCDKCGWKYRMDVFDFKYYIIQVNNKKGEMLYPMDETKEGK